MHINYAIKQLPQSSYLLLGHNDKGLCAAFFADSEEAVVQELQQSFATAVLQENMIALSDKFAYFESLLNGQAVKRDFELDLIGTDFQQTVWRALLEIPFGDVWTYSQLAEYIGKPTAFRAVASACAKNKLALVVPCHRVLSKNGALGGFRWGLEMKRKLLEMEQNCLQSEQ